MLHWVEEEEEAKMRVLKLPGIVENKKKARWLLTLSANSLHRWIKKSKNWKVTRFDSG